MKILKIKKPELKRLAFSLLAHWLQSNLEQGAIYDGMVLNGVIMDMKEVIFLANVIRQEIATLRQRALTPQERKEVVIDEQVDNQEIGESSYEDFPLSLEYDDDPYLPDASDIL